MTRSLLALVIALAAGLVPQVAAQKGRQPKWKLDRYTKNEPARMGKLGYVSYGPFDFGTRGRTPVTTNDIDATLAPAHIRWVETAHFKIGCALDSWSVGSDAATRKKIRGEIERLQERLPVFNPRARTLDPWLRLHLTALRLEDTYAEFLELVGVDESEFPKTSDDVIVGRGRFLGYGPYLGMPKKYHVLVTSDAKVYQTYTQTYIGRSGENPQRWHFTDVGVLFYGLATQLGETDLRHDTALHSNLIFNVTHSLLDGFRHYSYDLPVWISEGVSHYFQRRLSPRWNSFSENEGGVAGKKKLWKWKAETRRLLAAGKVTPFAEVYTWRDFSQMKFEDHVLVWSRWDYLMSFGPEKFSEFMFQVKGRVDPQTWLVDQEDLVGATREGLRKAYGLTTLSLDEKWRAWVLENY